MGEVGEVVATEDADADRRSMTFNEGLCSPLALLARRLSSNDFALP